MAQWEIEGTERARERQTLRGRRTEIGRARVKFAQQGHAPEFSPSLSPVLTPSHTTLCVVAKNCGMCNASVNTNMQTGTHGDAHTVTQTKHMLPLVFIYIRLVTMHWFSLSCVHSYKNTLTAHT